MARKKKELGLDKYGIQKTMRMSDYLSDGSGQFGINLMMALAGQVSYFYTEKAGIAAATVSLVLLLCKIFDAITDLPAGFIFDKIKTKKDKCKPWFIAMAVPAFIVTVLLFTIPKGMSTVAQIAYMLVTNVLITDIFYSVVMIPYNAYVVLRTQSPTERNNMALTRNIFAYISGAISTMLTIPITNALGGTQEAWIKYAAFAGLVAMVCLINVWAHCKEVIVVSDEQKQKESSIGMIQGFKMLLGSKPWVLCLLIGVVYNISNGLSQNTSGYYAKYIYGNDNLVAVTGGFGALAMLVSFFLANPLVKKFGLTKTVIIASSAGLLSNIVRMIDPYNMWVNVAFACIAQLFGIASITATAVMNNNNNEFLEDQYGVRLLGIASGLGGFVSKIGNGIGLSLATFLLAAFGHDASLEVQPESVKTGVMIFSIYVPMVLNFLTIVLVWIYKPFEKKYFELIAKRTAAQKEQAQPQE